MSLCFCGVNSLRRNDYLPHRCKQKKKKTERERERDLLVCTNYCNGHQCLTVRWGNKELKSGKCTWEWMWPFPRCWKERGIFHRDVELQRMAGDA